MTTKNIIGKVITNIYQSIKMEFGGLDFGKCFIEIDSIILFDFPFGPEDDKIETIVPEDAESVFEDLSDIPIYHVNKEGKTIREIADKYKKQQSSFAGKLWNLFFDSEFLLLKEYKTYKVEFQRNKLKHIKNKKIIDFIWYAEEIEKGFLLLENGYIITETLCSPNGTGQAGLNIFDNIDELISRRGQHFLKLSEYKQGNS